MYTHGLTTALTLYRQGTIDLETAAVLAGRSEQALLLAHRRQGGRPGSTTPDQTTRHGATAD
jgi:hypothetical protein